MVVYNFVAILWERPIFNNCLDDRVNGLFKLTTCGYNSLHFPGFILSCPCHSFPAKVEKNAKDENDETADDRELERGGDIGGTVELVDAADTVLDLVAAIAAGAV